jgi:hypothetical protein
MIILAGPQRKGVLMRHVGIDLHGRFLVVCVIDERGRSRKPRRFGRRSVKAIRSFLEKLGAFQAVIGASGGCYL